LKEAICLNDFLLRDPRAKWKGGEERNLPVPVTTPVELSTPRSVFPSAKRFEDALALPDGIPPGQPERHALLRLDSVVAPQNEARLSSAEL
jgi:hypothetical protein